jgi:hypothetical protein
MFKIMSTPDLQCFKSIKYKFIILSDGLFFLFRLRESLRQ